MKLIKCEICWKEIEKKWSRKYCTKCRIAVDKELNRKCCLKHAKKYNKKESDF